MKNIESCQYQAALAISGCWKGTNRDRLYQELGWESLSDRRWLRRLVQFYKIMNNMTPQYLIDPVPNLREHLFGTRLTNALHPVSSRTDKYKNSFYPNTVSSWNDIGPEIRSIQSISSFKTELLEVIRPPKKSMYDIHNPEGTKLIFQLRLGLSKLKLHKMNHNFKDTSNSACACGSKRESTSHYLLSCKMFHQERKDLLNSLNPILIRNNLILNEDEKVALILYGGKSLTLEENRSILNATIKYILDTKRLSHI